MNTHHASGKHLTKRFTTHMAALLSQPTKKLLQHEPDLTGLFPQKILEERYPDAEKVIFVLVSQS